MELYSYNNCPDEIKIQLNSIVSRLAQTFGEQLVGVYLHGSLVSDSFNERNSDVDILVVVDREINTNERVELVKYFCEVHCMPSPIEISIIYTEHLTPWQHPTPCQFHFSGYWKPQYEKFIENNDLSHWILTNNFKDSDIACHVTLVKQSGICLYGKPINEVFPDVTKIWKNSKCLLLVRL